MTTLSEAHRQAQVRVGISTVLAIRQSWKLLDPADIDGTLPGWLAVASPIVTAHHDTSARLAARYYSLLRSARGHGTDFEPRPATPPPARLVSGALVLTGVTMLRRATLAGPPAPTQVTAAGDSAASTAMYYAQQGGRETITTAAATDPKAIGWARSTSGEACAFCALLASRGPVYRSEDSGGFEAHPGCSCSAEPVFSRDDPWPAGSREYRDAYRQVAKGEKDPLNAFRRHLAAQRRETADA